MSAWLEKRLQWNNAFNILRKSDFPHRILHPVIKAFLHMQSLRKWSSHTPFFGRWLRKLWAEENCKNLFFRRPCVAGVREWCLLLPLALSTIFYLWSLYSLDATCHHPFHCTISCTLAFWEFRSLKTGGRKTVSSLWKAAAPLAQQFLAERSISDFAPVCRQRCVKVVTAALVELVKNWEPGGHL